MVVGLEARDVVGQDALRHSVVLVGQQPHVVVVRLGDAGGHEGLEGVAHVLDDVGVGLDSLVPNDVGGLLGAAASDEHQ